MTVTANPKTLVLAGGIALVTALIVGAVILHDRPDTKAPVEITAVPARRAVEVAPAVPDSISRDGVYVAGRQIRTGTYAAEGGSFCYWARLKYNRDGATSILVSSYDPDRQVVPGDVFQTSGCGKWVTVR